MQFTYEYTGESYTINLERQADGTLKANIGANEYKVSASAAVDNAYLLRINGERFLAHTAADAEAHYVHVNGTQFKLEKTTGQRRKRKGAAQAGDLSAEMPGQVIEVRVVVGANVQAGDVLVILEAMKMEIRITAPYAGIVEKVFVNTGTIVDRGQILVEVKPTET